MHGLTGGNWKRNTRTVMVRKKNSPVGNRPASNGFITYRSPGHRASSRPSSTRWCRWATTSRFGPLWTSSRWEVASKEGARHLYMPSQSPNTRPAPGALDHSCSMKTRPAGATAV
jgi:hypothetical protein